MLVYLGRPERTASVSRYGGRAARNGPPRTSVQQKPLPFKRKNTGKFPQLADVPKRPVTCYSKDVFARPHFGYLQAVLPPLPCSGLVSRAVRQRRFSYL